MNQQQKTKIQLFFGGFCERRKSAAEYFVSVEFSFASGRKNYKGTITSVEDGFSYNFSGKRVVSDFSEALDLLLRIFSNTILQTFNTKSAD